jgi:CPA2 family monovalent cation:H+ antiporter-2
VVAIPDSFEAGQVVEQARAINAALRIVARAHSEEEIDHLRAHGATIVIMGEHLIANAMIADVRATGLFERAPPDRTLPEAAGPPVAEPTAPTAPDPAGPQPVEPPTTPA